METDLLFLLMLFVFYFLSRIGGKKKPQQRAPGPQPRPEPQAPRGEAKTEFDDALREIREALGWPERPEPVEVEPVEQAPAPRSPAEMRESAVERRDREKRQARRRRESVPAPAPREEPTAQPDAYAAYTGVDAAPAQKSRLDLPPPVSPTDGSSSSTHPILEKLRSSDGAREAVILSEIFEPRWRKLKSQGH